MLSIIIPCFNEENNVESCAQVLSDTLKSASIEFELLFINDGSKDATCEKITGLFGKYPLSLYSFSRNFGKEAAMFCGLKHAKGECAVIYDCDMQFPASTIVEMYRKWEEGYMVVEGIKKSRQKESFIKRLGANVFYALLRNGGNIDLKNATDFKLMDRKVVNALNSLEEKDTFFRALSSWVGFTSCSIEFEVAERKIGTSKWNFKSLFRYAVHNLTSFTTLPMQVVTFCGVVFFLFAVILGIDTLYNFFTNQALGGFTTVILLILITGSIVMISLGIIGFYLSKIYSELQHRPRYIIEKELIDKE